VLGTASELVIGRKLVVENRLRCWREVSKTVLEWYAGEIDGGEVELLDDVWLCDHRLGICSVKENAIYTYRWSVDQTEWLKRDHR